ncbi:MAG: hypothetical protein EPO68_08145 [Planctomycetota bacterium]|nr:MAG: hypothetical protein EPO68_08145 [Planctomycetota bacterium]
MPNARSSTVVPLSRAACALAVALLAPAAAAQALWTVHPNGSADFTSIQAAVDAAAPGDHVLVLAGAHANVVLERAITLTSTGGAAILKPQSGPGATAPALSIRNLPAGEHVCVSGLTVFVGGGGAPHAVGIADCAGSVWLQDMFVDSYGAAALDVRACASVVVADCTLQTNLVPALSDGTPQSAPGARVADGARLHAWSSDFFGSHGTLQGGGLPTPNAAADGGAGLVVEDALVHCYGGDIRGSSGSTFFGASCTSGGNGGDGVVVIDGPSGFAPEVRLVGASVTAGFPGSHQAGCGPAPIAGQIFDAAPGSLVALPGPARRFTLPGHANSGAPVALRFDGAAGDFAFVLVSGAAAPGTSIAGLDLHVALAPLLVVGPFAVPGASATYGANAPLLPAGVEGIALPLQAVHLDASLALHASSPRLLLAH